MRWRAAGGTVAAVALVIGAGTAVSALPPSGSGPIVVVSAPLSGTPWIGRAIRQGALLAAQQLAVGPDGRRLRLQVRDNRGSPEIAAADARRAVAEGAVAIITDGTGAGAVARITTPARLPVLVVFDGGASFVDAQRFPTVFRLAPANRYMCRRLADYLAGRTGPVALLGEDSSYGRDGVSELGAALVHDGIAVSDRAVLPRSAADISALVLRARRSGARALLVWAGAVQVAETVRAMRAAGWTAPVYTGPTGEDPAVRRYLADHPGWLDGLTFVSFRMTTEQGPGPFEAFRADYEHRFGPDLVGLRSAGTPVVQPPDWPVFAYDAVRLVAAAVDRGGARPGGVLAGLQTVSVVGANGDQRGFSATQREGVSASDMYFARFSHQRFAPVTDDLLSTQLPAVAQ